MKTFFTTVSTVAFVAALGVGGYFAIKFIIHRLAPLRFHVDDVTMVTWLVALLAAFIIAHSIGKLSEQLRLNRLHSQKTEAYRLFLTLWADRLQHRHLADPQLHARVDADMESLDRLLVVCGSPDLVNVHAAMRKLENHAPELESALAKGLMAIRRDLGLTVVGLKSQTLLDLLLDHTQRVAAKFGQRQDIRPRVTLTPNC